MELRIGLLCLLLVFYTDITKSAAPVCKSGCIGQNNNVLKLQEGTTYVYNLEGKTETSVPKTKGPNGDSTKLNIRAKVEVNVQAKCAALIRLKNVQIIGPDDKKHGSLTKLEENPLRVSLNGGALAPQVCSVPEDDYTSLNIKRAIASLLQINTAESATIPQEVDVFGACPTNYNIRQDGGATIVRKNRDLNKCAYRENIRQEIFAIPTAGNSELQSSPLLEPTFEAVIRIQGGVVESAVAEESYLLRPFADRSNGVKTKITTKLTLESKAAGSISDTTKEPRSIIFENPHEGVSSSIQSVLAALHKVADNTVGVDAARNVAELVAIIRRASSDDLLSVYGQVKAGAGFKNKNLAKKVYTDALFRSGSGDSIAVAVELLKTREIVGDSAKLWYLSFALARHVSSKALEKAATLLNDAALPNEAYLGIGALAGKFCREHLCESVPQFEALLKQLAAPLSTAAPSSRPDENKLVAALKALRNVKKLTDEVAGKVAAVIKETKAPTRVRVAALETAASDACKNKLQKAAAEILNNREEDAELRIKAYLVLVECPNPKTANKLSEMLENENVNQVGAFITSHLRNLRATAKPDRQEARALLQNVKPIRRYPIDVRKFSQNYEASYDIDALGSSASADSSIIFSQKSYLPRSANLNLTAEFFGHAFNLFEISGRAENLERVIESFFGPKGYIRNTKPEDILKDSNSELQKLKQHLEQKYKKLTRSKRSITRESLTNFGEKVKLRNSELDNNVDFDVSLRLLGNELLWVNLGEKSTTPEEIINKVADVLERGFGDTKDFDQRIQNHAVLLDSELAYPTSTGLPLKLTATGTSVVHLKVAGSLDLAALLKNPKNGEAKIEVRPSASVEIVGQMSIDGYAVEAGVKLAATLHTATGSEVSVKLLDGEGIDLNIGLPIKESDILTVQTEVLVAVRERGQPQTTSLLEFQIPRKDFQGCFDQLLPVVGLTLCGKVGFPNDPQAVTSGAALYPLNGHSKLSLRLDKEDESLTTYHFRLQYSLKDPTNRRIEALIETPGSKNPREISLLAEAKTLPNKELSVKLITPFYKLRGQALITESSTEYTLSGLAELEGIFSYKAKLGVLINGDTYTPIVEYTPIDDKQPKIVKVEGTVTVEKAGPAKRTYKFNNVRLITSNPGEVSVDGTITKDVNLFQTDLKVGYGKQNIGVKTKLQRQGGDNLKISAEITPSQYPDFGFGLKYDYQRDKTHVENSLSFVHGRDLTSKQSRLNLLQQITYKVESIHKFEVTTRNTLSYPLFGLDGKFEGAATDKSVHYDLLLGYEKNTITSKLNAKTGISKPGDYAIDFSASALEHGFKLESKRSITAPNKSKFTNNLVFTPGGKYSLDADVTHQLDKNNIDTRLEVTVKLDGSSDPYKLDIGLLLNPQERGAHSKISLGADNLLDAEVKQKTQASGSFRLNVRHSLESHGQYTLSKDKAVDADALIHIIPIKRKIKGTAKLTVTGGNHVGTIDILYDAESDPSKKISIQTETLLGSKAINSKNKISANGKEVLLNFNGEGHGKLSNGGVSGGYDITLPNGIHLVARGKQTLRLIPSNSDGTLFLEVGYSLEAGKPLTKITVDTSARNVDLNRLAFDTKFETAFNCESGDAYYKQSAKSTPSDGKLLIELQNSLGGSRLGEWQYNGKTKITASRAEVSYHATAALSTKYSVDVQGKVHPGVEDNVHGIEQTIVIKTPVESAKEVKLVTAGRYVQGVGAKPCQVKISQEVNVDGKVLKAAVDGSGSKTEGSVKGNLVLPGIPAYDGQVKYKHNNENEVLKSEVDIDGSHDDKKLNLNVKASYTKTLTLLNVHVTGATPFEKAKKLDINGNYKRVSANAGNLDVKALVNDDKADITVKYDLTTNHLLLDNNAVVNGQKYRFYSKWDRKSDRSGQFEEQIIWANNGGGQYDITSHYDLESLENFLISVTVNSEKYNINNLKIDLGNRPSKSGTANKVNLSATNKEGKILVGSASYAIKQDDAGYSVEGKGSVTYGNENFPLTYKISSSRLSKNVNNEIGGRGLISVDFGKGLYKFDLKYSDKELHYENRLCLDKKCMGSELLLSHQILGLAKVNKQFVIKASNDFPQFKVYKLEIQGKSEQDGLLGSSEATGTLQGVTYSIQHYVRATEAGIIATAPTREIAAIANYQLPSLKQTPTAAKLDASLYLDHKKNPADKATLSLEGSLKNENNQAIAAGVVKFSHPSLQRDLSVKGEASVDLKETAAKAGLEVDVLNKKSQKIILNAEAKQLIVGNGRNFTANAQVISKGLVLDLGASAHGFFDREGGSVGAFAYYIDDKNLKKDAGVLLSAGTKKSEILLRIPGHTLLDGSATITSAGDVKTVNAELTIAEGETGVLEATVTGFREIKANLHPKSDPKRSLDGLIGVTKEKLEIRAERKEGGKTEPLVSAVVHLDEANLFKLDYDVNFENIKKPLKYFETLLRSTIDHLKAISESLSKELNTELINLSEALKKAQPNFKALIQQYQNAFKAIREELEKDPNYQQLATVFQKLFGGVLDVIEAQIKVIISTYEKLSEQVTSAQGKLVEAYKKISPDLIDAYKKLVAIFAEAAKSFLDIGAKLTNEALELIRQHEKDFKLIINNLSTSFQDIGRVTIKQVTQLRNEVRDLANLLIDQVKSLPIYDNFKERLAELVNFELPPHFFELFEELSATAQDFMPTPELKELVKAIFTYVEKRLKRQAVDDVAELSAISKQAAGAVQGLIAAVKEYFGIQNLDTKSVPFFGFNLPLPLPSASILKLPELGNIRINIVSLLAAVNEFPSPLEFLYTYRPKLNILDNIPPFKTYGLILKGHHFFTFDKTHIALQGSCSYILAQDFQDGNFSVVANLENGKVKSLTIADKTDVVELLNDNTVTLNGQPSELPIETDQIAGWRRYGSTNIKLKAGVFITYYIPSDLYVIRVSGFYFGRTRGLLGTINNEAYDELTLPNGHIAKTGADLANAYKLGQCAAVAPIAPATTQSPECVSLFTSDSPLRAYFGVVNPAPYREACDNHVGMMPDHGLAAACEVAAAYVQALRQEGVFFVSIPPQCAQCTINGKKLELGQSEQVKSPAGKADVVIVVEQSSHNAAVFKDLVTPLIAKLSGDLKSRNIGDVEFALIGYGGPKQKWPAHYGNNGKYTYHGKSDNIKFGDTERLSAPYDTLLKKVKFVQKFIEVELGLEDIVIAMTEANKYPFRTGAAKIIVLVNSTPCSKSPIFPFSLQTPRSFNIYRFYREHGLNFHIVSPLAGLEKKDIIGFDSEKVYSLAHPEGVADRAGVTYADDLCLGFSQYYGGAAFSSQNLISAQPDQKQKFVDTVSQRIADGAVKHTNTEDCTCALRAGVFPVPECTVAA